MKRASDRAPSIERDDHPSAVRRRAEENGSPTGEKIARRLFTSALGALSDAELMNSRAPVRSDRLVAAQSIARCPIIQTELSARLYRTDTLLITLPGISPTARSTCHVVSYEKLFQN